MAVAVKTSQGASTGPLASPAILSLVGVVYLLACLAIVFKLIPELWWSAWDKVGLSSYTFVGGALLAVLGLAVGIGLLVVGARLLGPNPPVGIRSGVFVAFVGLLTVLLLTRWASLWLEHWVFTGALTEQAGLGLTIACGVGLLLLGLWLFLRPATHRIIVRLEEMGWFHAIAYKTNQGQKVRRGTIIGLLLIVGAGIYTLISHNTLGKGSPDWALNIPFSGKVAVESYGDVQSFLAQQPDSAKGKVRISWGGSDRTYQPGQVVDFKDYRSVVETLVKSSPELSKYAPALEKETEPSAFVLAVNRQVLGGQMRNLLAENFYPEGVSGRLETKFNETPWGDLTDSVSEFYREGHNNPKLGAEFRVPSAVLLADRYALRSANTQADPALNVKVELKGDSDLKEGEVVPRAKFDEEYEKIEKLRKEGRDRALPTYRALAPASGQLQYASFTLLPSVQFTVPLLLLAGSMWLAWRVVNMPAFADFLIATEAELNKVSWASQRKLVQDTIVVLVTVFLMAVFLFGMDWAWKVVLSWQPIGVLHIPKETSQQNKPAELKKW
ncbi:MAG: preprotein translocase subunit SecE [Gemmataceae bacterium]